MSRFQNAQLSQFPEDQAERLAEMVEPTMIASIWLGASSTLALVFWGMFAG